MADGCTISLKKDGLGNIGGVLALNDGELAQRCRALLTITEGFPTYGGLAGRDLEALTQGLLEITDPDYLRYRIRTAEYLAEKAWAAGVPTVRPPGGHAVYLDAGALLPHIAPHELPAQALGLRAVPRGRRTRSRDRHTDVRSTTGRSARRGSPQRARASRAPATGVHAEPHRLRRGGHRRGGAAARRRCAGCASPNSLRGCATSPLGSLRCERSGVARAPRPLTSWFQGWPSDRRSGERTRRADEGARRAGSAGRPAPGPDPALRRVDRSPSRHPRPLVAARGGRAGVRAGTRLLGLALGGRRPDLADRRARGVVTASIAPSAHGRREHGSALVVSGPGAPVRWRHRDALPLLRHGCGRRSVPGLASVPRRHRIRVHPPRRVRCARPGLGVQPPRGPRPPVAVGKYPCVVHRRDQRRLPGHLAPQRAHVDGAPPRRGPSPRGSPRRRDPARGGHRAVSRARPRAASSKWSPTPQRSAPTPRSGRSSTTWSTTRASPFCSTHSPAPPSRRSRSSGSLGTPRSSSPPSPAQEIVRIDDVMHDARYGHMAPHFGMPAGHLPVRSYLAVPVRARDGNVLGGLFFGHPEAAQFTEVDERIVAGIAIQAAIAFDNARLYESEHEARVVSDASRGRAQPARRRQPGAHRILGARHDLERACRLDLIIPCRPVRDRRVRRRRQLPADRVGPRERLAGGSDRDGVFTGRSRRSTRTR